MLDTRRTRIRVYAVHTLFRGLAALLALAMHARTGVAQDRPYASIVLRVPGSARALAMGNAAVAGRDDDVVFYSPAMVAVARGTSVSMERYSATTRGGALSTVGRLATGGVAVGASWLSYASTSGSFPGSREELTTTGGETGSSLLATLAVAQTFKRIHVGAAAKYVSDNQGTRREKALFDVGAARSFTAWRLPFTAALAVQNLGSDYAVALPSGGSAAERGQLPMRAALGASAGAPLGPLDIGLAVQVSVLRDGFVTPAGGLEVGYSWIDGVGVSVRAGGRRPEDGEGAWTAGAGFSFDRFSLDYALETLAGGAVAHRVGIRIR